MQKPIKIITAAAGTLTSLVNNVTTSVYFLKNLKISKYIRASHHMNTARHLAMLFIANIQIKI